MGLLLEILVAVVSLQLAPVPAAGGATLVGSRVSMIRQNGVAKRNRLAFAQVPADVARLVEAGQLTPVPGNDDYRLKGVDLPFAHPVMRAFIERLAREYRRVCGEQLVVTSLVRPVTMQPPNAHPLSVHPAGIAVDLSIPDRPECRLYLERALLALEERGFLDATEERSPPHLHVAVYPRAYTAFVMRMARDSAEGADDGRPGPGHGPQPGLPWPGWLVAGMLAVFAGAAIVRFLIVGQARRRGREED